MLHILLNIRLEYIDNVIAKIEDLGKRVRRIFVYKSTRERFDLSYYNQNSAYIFFDIILNLNLCAIINQKTHRENDIKVK